MSLSGELQEKQKPGIVNENMFRVTKGKPAIVYIFLPA